VPDATPPRTAVILPGRLYGPRAPLLAYAADAAENRGARIHPLHWTPPPRLDPANGPDPADTAVWVREQVTPVLDELAAADRTPLLIGKSLGSLGAGVATDRGLPAVWLTPLLRTDVVVDALRRAPAPCLLIGGTADASMWDGALARKLSPYVFEVDGADHAMHVPGPLAASAAVLGLVVTAVERFLDEVVWR
jgi:hypothetical protein